MNLKNLGGPLLILKQKCIFEPPYYTARKNIAALACEPMATRRLTSPAREANPQPPVPETNAPIA